MDLLQELKLARHHLAASDFSRAGAILQNLLTHSPGHVDALELLGIVAGNRGDYTAAANHMQAAIAAGGSSPQLFYYAAVAHQRLGDHAGAIPLFSRAIEAHPYFFEALHDRGLSQAAQGEPEAALASFDAAMKLKPGAFEVLYNKGKALGDLGRFDEEISCYQRAIQLKPDFADGYVNLGVALRDLHRFDEAMRQFKKAITLDANSVLARCNRAQTNLLLGVFDHGWREYEWRWLDGTPRHPVPGKPWLGESGIGGKTILLHGEQGLGDTIQFARYAPHVAELGATVIVRAQRSLLELLRQLPGVQSVVADDEPLPVHDLHCPLLSLPLAFKTTLASIPAGTPYLQADVERAQVWRDRLGPRTRPRIGLVWSGSTTHRNDAHRSTALERLRPWLERDAEFIALQQEIRETDFPALAGLPGLRDVRTELTSFTDTAALVGQLDLVITVDTSVAHLAGALGRPTWVLLPHSPDWRWLLNRDDSPWYPSMCLFRQPAPLDWDGALEQVGGALDDFLAGLAH